jgi:hypothetical protein
MSGTRAPSLPPQLPSSGRALQPIIWNVVERFAAVAREIQTWQDAERLVPAQHEGWSGLVERLQLINCFQWRQEDRSRDPAAADSILAAVKRSIDASNQRRVQTVSALDELLHAGLTGAGLLAADAPLHSESPGSMADRLTVLALKIHHVREALPRQDRAATELRAKLRSLTEQMADLTDCLDRFLMDVVRGRVGWKLYRQIKVYRDPTTGDPRPE